MFGAMDVTCKRSSGACELLSSCPSPEDLNQWLLERGCDTTEWGQGDAKSVSQLWREVESEETVLELQKDSDGRSFVVRVAHVLRAMVCSQESRAKGSYLLNTWQEFPDGHRRSRNALLSEKLKHSELPLQDHVSEVCCRAVSEEMELLEPTPVGDGVGDTPCSRRRFPLSRSVQVTGEFILDSSIELQESRSYPGLITRYWLHTVEVVCEGLPSCNFNTFEFDQEDGLRRLKYVHAWVWMSWAEINVSLCINSQTEAIRKPLGIEDYDEADNTYCSDSVVFGSSSSSGSSVHVGRVSSVSRNFSRRASAFSNWALSVGCQATLLMRFHSHRSR
mmetsp:Transcript_44044/g.116492  ORF Transcript_44044/g.116492 Transcript_44044/m.116492 type:complete len:334 (-) Transcript_44044:235-1236(-)